MKAEDRASLIDEYGKLSDEIKAFKPKVDRHKQLADQIQAWYKSKPASAELIESGNHYILTASPRTQERSIFAMAKLAAYLGMKKFLSLCSFTMKNFDENVPVDDRPQFCTQERTGSRKLETVPKQLLKKAA